MTDGKMIAFVSNYDDNSTEAGFEFTFHCDICNEGYKSRFVESRTHKKKSLLHGLGQVAGAAGSITGYNRSGYAVQTGSNVLGERFQGMSPEWHKEHQEALELTMHEAQGAFKRCPKCHKWVCDNDWNEEAQLCIEDAPRESVEVAAARAAKMKADIEQKAQNTQVFTGEIDQRQTMCPKCGKPAGSGKFCNSCGQPLGMAVCSKCGAKNAAGTRFCGECGNKLM
ncbi:MAG: zinc ribbon domain-containing protein [Methanomassiliicoccales archaeon]|jgi:hypothetical protein